MIRQICRIMLLRRAESHAGASGGRAGLKAGNVGEVSQVQGPEAGLADQGAGGDGEIDFPAAGPGNGPVQLSGKGSFCGAKGQRGLSRKKGLLVSELGQRARPAPPLVEDQGGDGQPLALLESPSQRRCRAPRPSEAVDDYRGVQNDHRNGSSTDRRPARLAGGPRAVPGRLRLGGEMVAAPSSRRGPVTGGGALVRRACQSAQNTREWLPERPGFWGGAAARPPGGAGPRWRCRE